MSLPWNPDFKPPAVDEDLLKEITGAVEGAVNTATEVATTVGSGIAGAVAGQAAAQAVQDIGATATAVETGVEGVASAVVPTIAPAPTPSSTATTSTPAGGVIPGDWVAEIEKNAASQAEAALKAALPVVQGRIVAATASALERELNKTLGQPQVATLPSGTQLTKIDAWERAGRTFLMGLFTTLLGAIITVIGDSASSGTVNFFTTDGWKSVAVLGGGTIVTAAFSYLYRYIKEPAGAALDSSTK